MFALIEFQMGSLGCSPQCWGLGLLLGDEGRGAGGLRAVMEAVLRGSHNYLLKCLLCVATVAWESSGWVRIRLFNNAG